MHIKEALKSILEGKGIDDALTDLLEASQGKRCEMPGYGGLPSGGDLGSATEYEIGAQRFFEAAHCALGSLAKIGWNDAHIKYEIEHINEEIGIMEHVLTEYSRSLYNKRLSDGYYSKETAQRTIESFRKHLPALRKRASSLKSKARSWFPDAYPIRLGMTELLYDAVVALCEVLEVNIRRWDRDKRILLSAYGDHRTTNLVKQVRVLFKKLISKKDSY